MFNTLKFEYAMKLFKAHKKAFAYVVCLMICETLVSLSVPFLAGQYSEYFISNATGMNQTHIYILLLWIALFAVHALLRFLSTYNVSLIGARLMAELSCRLYDHIQVLPMQYFKENKRGDVLSMLSNDLAVISYFASSVLTNLIPSVLVLIGAAILMFTIEPSIALLIIVFVPAIFIVLKFVSRGMQPISRALIQHQADSMALASENIGAISLIKAFNRESSESKKFKHKTSEILALRSQQLKLQAILSPLVQFMASIAVLIVIVLSFIRFQSGNISIPDLISLMLYGLIFTRPLGALAGLYGQIQQVMGASDRLLTFYHVESEFQSSANQHLVIKNADICFDNVSFAFKNKPSVFESLSFTLDAKHTMLLYGKNGGGKTTLLHLLMKFLEPTKGKISIDNQDIAQMNNSSVRAAIALVSQDVLLCNGSILDNITYGVVAPSAERISKACQASGADRFIQDLPQGYQTAVGEGGVLLSGGQKQRISLARALLLEPHILLLDEPTSMLDEFSSQSFKDEFTRLFSRYTVIVISHDKSLIEIADVVYKLDNGKLTQEK
ncbi:MAG: ABC transporter ATP-binding protein [Paraglaciecola sp.]|uniref:ABC transporter ATP-binding protein n=1 Tax=Paraglaciecola sp. TaxID=1920173 RepID=UPI0032972B5C